MIQRGERRWTTAALPAGPEWPVTVLPNGGGKRWVEQGIVDLFVVDPAALTNATHARVHRATVSGEGCGREATIGQ